MRDNSGTLGCAFVILLVIAGIVSLLSTWVTDEAAIERIQESYPPGTVIQIIHDSGNEIPLVHSVDDVTFELSVQRPNAERPEYVSARCTRHLFADMVCRVYEPGTGQQ